MNEHCEHDCDTWKGRLVMCSGCPGKGVECSVCSGKLVRTEDDEYGLYRCESCGKLYDSDLVSGEPIMPRKEGDV